MERPVLDNEKAIMDALGDAGYGARFRGLEALGVKLVEDRREGARVRDLSGKEYIDCFCAGGELVLGRRNPEMIRAMREALKHADIGNFVLLSAQKAALAKRLAEITPGALQCTVYAVGRGEANDFAMKLARGYSGRKELISFAGGAHGSTGFALSLSDEATRPGHFGPLIPEVKHVALDAAELRKAISDKTAAVIVEPIQSDAGLVFPPDGLLAEARKLCDRHGAALVFDEGQTGLGRTGKLFACGHSGVTPDILTIGNGLGGGIYPLTAAVFTSRLNRFMLKHPLIHLSTFAGADIGCLVALAALDLIEKGKLSENASKVGKYLLAGLEGVVEEHSDKFVAARGAGLLVGMEAKDAATAAGFVKGLAAAGVLALPAANAPNVVRFTPPIDITESEADAIIEAAETAAK